MAVMVLACVGWFKYNGTNEEVGLQIGTLPFGVQEIQCSSHVLKVLSKFLHFKGIGQWTCEIFCQK